MISRSVLATVGLVTGLGTGISSAQAAVVLVPVLWDAVPTSCVPAQSAVDLFEHSSNLVRFKSGGIGDISLTCAMPLVATHILSFSGWAQGDGDGSGGAYFVEIALRRVDRNNGTWSDVCVAETRQNAYGAFSASCDFDTDLARYTYFIYLRLHRDTTAFNPELHVVSVHGYFPMTVPPF